MNGVARAPLRTTLSPQRVPELPTVDLPPVVSISELIWKATMDRSTLRLPDPIAGSPNGERRRRVRQKLHTPVYASFNGPQTGMVVDLSELLDLHEDGFAVQTSEPLEMNRAVTLCLDLPETKSYIHGSGQVMWSDQAGRGGIRFFALPQSSRQILKEWLFANLLIACSNHAARTEQLARREEEKILELAPDAAGEAPNVIPISDRSEILSRVETGLAPSQTQQAASLQVEAVRRMACEMGDDFDAVLQLITDRALSLTGASGAALALLTENKIICRARAGEPAPPLGAPVDVRQGLSGECVCSGLLVSCGDMENDPRVDPGVGRTLGIGSLMAAPIVSDFRVLGLLEVFSPHPRSFTELHETVLARLVEMIPKTHREKTQLGNLQPENTQPETPIRPEAVSDVAQPPASELGSTEFELIRALLEALREPEPEVPGQVWQRVPAPIVSKQIPEPVTEQVLEPPPKVPSRWPHLLLLGLAVAVVAMTLGYLAAPIIEKRWANSAPASQRSFQRAQPQSLADLRNLADHGDAEAQWQMGVRCHNGEGVPQDDAQAVQWWQLAAEQGHVDAQSHLGAYYWAGRGVPEDLSKAYFWSAIALAEGDENSKSRLEGLASQMTQAQVSAARQQAEVWIRQHNSAKPAGN